MAAATTTVRAGAEQGGAPALALFDLDGTLLPIDSDHAFGEFVVRIGWADAQEHRHRNDAFYADYQAGRLDIHAYIEFATSAWRGRAAHVLAAASARFMHEVIGPVLLEPARALVARHREAGDELAIVTSTNDFITAPIAAALGIPHLLATELERDAAGGVTGRIRGTPALGQGKVERVAHWLAARGTTLQACARSTYYGDSTNDLPLLEQVTHPVATNPGPALARIAAQRGWPVLRLFP
jgi:HAD superfamily hydrolase (TIGR01490 family)